MNKRNTGKVNINRNARVADDTPLPYPTHKMLGVLPTEEVAWQVIDELRSRGFTEEEIELWGGQTGADAVQKHISGGGLIDRLKQAVMEFGNEGDYIDYYTEALRRGQFLLVVPATTAEAKESALEIMARHGGHRIAYFDELVIREFTP